MQIGDHGAHRRRLRLARGATCERRRGVAGDPAVGGTAVGSTGAGGSVGAAVGAGAQADNAMLATMIIATNTYSLDLILLLL